MCDELPNYLGWGDPVQQLCSLQKAMRHLRSTESRACRLDAATSWLNTYQPDDFPECIRQRAINVSEARQAARRDHGTNSLFNFRDLGRSRQLSLEKDIEALFVACLIDIGRMERHSGPEGEWADICYPKPGSRWTLSETR
jgi:hypothetical protein